jgi:hypothetical protein
MRQGYRLPQGVRKRTAGAAGRARRSSCKLLVSRQNGADQPSALRLARQSVPNQFRPPSRCDRCVSVVDQCRWLSRSPSRKNRAALCRMERLSDDFWHCQRGPPTTYCSRSGTLRKGGSHGKTSPGQPIESIPRKSRVGPAFGRADLHSLPASNAPQVGPCPRRQSHQQWALTEGRRLVRWREEQANGSTGPDRNP